MDVRQCRRCRKLFQFRGNHTCPQCVNELDEAFVQVREYMYTHPGATIQDICDNTGAEEDDVLGWLREGRLILNSDNAALLSCETCGTPIRTGRFCESCMNNMRSTLESGARALRGDEPSYRKAPRDSDSSGMHLDFKKRR